MTINQGGLSLYSLVAPLTGAIILLAIESLGPSSKTGVVTRANGPEQIICCAKGKICHIYVARPCSVKITVGFGKRGGVCWRHEQSPFATDLGRRASTTLSRCDARTNISRASGTVNPDAHDRAAAFAALEAALDLSPSLALAYILGAAVLSWAGEAPRTIDWVQRALRLSPFDPWKFIAYRSLALANFLMARYGLAADTARRAVQFNPGFGSSYMLLAAPLAKLGRHEEAGVAVARLLEREPAFRLSGQLKGVNCAPALADALAGALVATGIPQ